MFLNHPPTSSRPFLFFYPCSPFLISYSPSVFSLAQKGRLLLFLIHSFRIPYRHSSSFTLNCILCLTPPHPPPHTPVSVLSYCKAEPKPFLMSFYSLRWSGRLVHMSRSDSVLLWVLLVCVRNMLWWDLNIFLCFLKAFLWVYWVPCKWCASISWFYMGCSNKVLDEV